MQGESVTNMKKGITQAYKLVPWRGEMQWLGVITLALVTISLIAWIYLSVSSKASIAGRSIQQYQYDKSKTIQSIAQLETDLARITSSTEMASRAKKLGFKELSADRYTYMVIPGYNGKPICHPCSRLDPDITGGCNQPGIYPISLGLDVRPICSTCL